MVTITILGTGSPEASPVLFSEKGVQPSRLRPSLLIESNGKNILFDCSPDIRQQLLTSGITHIDAVFVTHYHFDHFWGIGDLDQLHWVGKDNFTVYVPPTTKKYVEEHLSWLSLDIQIQNKPIQIGEVLISPFIIEHSSYLDMYGFVIEIDGKKIVYAPDLKQVHDEELKLTLHADLLIADGQYILGKYIDDNDHAGGDELVQLIKTFQAKKVWLVAYSEYWYKKTAQEANKDIPEEFFIPNDFDSIKF